MKISNDTYSIGEEGKLIADEIDGKSDITILVQNFFTGHFCTMLASFYVLASEFNYM